MKFHGKVGFWMDDIEVSPGVYRPSIVERNYYGDITRNGRRWQSEDRANDSLKIENSILILSDLFARKHIASIRYVLWNDVKLKVTNVTINYPRITLEIGGFYEGGTADASESP